MTTFFRNSSHLGYYLLWIVQDANRREVFIYSWDINCLETDLVLIDLPFLMARWYAHSIFNSLNHASVQFKTILSTFITIGSYLRTIMVFDRDRAPKSRIFQVFELFLVLHHRIMGFVQRWEIVYCMLVLSFINELNRVINCVILVLYTWRFRRY